MVTPLLAFNVSFQSLYSIVILELGKVGLIVTVLEFSCLPSDMNIYYSYFIIKSLPVSGSCR